jgi:hypothetical protein
MLFCGVENSSADNKANDKIVNSPRQEEALQHSFFPLSLSMHTSCTQGLVAQSVTFYSAESSHNSPPLAMTEEAASLKASFPIL